MAASFKVARGSGDWEAWISCGQLEPGDNISPPKSSYVHSKKGQAALFFIQPETLCEHRQKRCFLKDKGAITYCHMGLAVI